MIASGAATALDVQGDDCITPVRWDDWLKLPVREHDNAVNTPRGPVRVRRLGNAVARRRVEKDRGAILRLRGDDQPHAPRGDVVLSRSDPFDPRPASARSDMARGKHLRAGFSAALLQRAAR